MYDDSDSYLRLSGDTPIGTPDYLSDYNDDAGDLYFYKHSPSLHRPSRISLFVQSLTYAPLGMRWRQKSKSRRRRLCVCAFNFILLAFLFCLVYSLTQAIFRPSYSNPPQHYKDLVQRARSSGEPGLGNPNGQKIFIASNIIQHELIHGAWGASLLKLIHYLGPQNVFVSIYENDSGPETALALSWLRDQLSAAGCAHSIVFGDHLPLSNFPTVVTPSGESRVKRLTYLAEVRNRLLRPLDSPVDSRDPLLNFTSTRFDRIFFINDVYFKPEDALNLLLSTNVNPATGIAEYQLACSMDFIRGGTLYDSFVIRDIDGYGISWFLYPWFTFRGSGRSRRDVLVQTDAVRVKSCWSGMAAYEATPFLRSEVLDRTPQPPHLSFPSRNVATGASQQASHLDLRQSIVPLRFRHQSDLFWEASECCLLNADLPGRFPRLGAQMFINPYIRVAYDAGTFAWQPVIQRFERGFVILQLFADMIAFGQKYNPRRTEVVGRSGQVKKWVYDNDALNGERMRNSTVDSFLGLQFPLGPERVWGMWKLVEEVAEPGGFCGLKTLFIMMGDLEKANRGNTGRNWEKIEVPA